MNIQHLKYALEVEKTGSISKAAENLYMNQPHLSKAIRELEENIGINVFNRTSKGVIPTKKGAEFLMYAKGIVDKVDEVENMYKKHEANTHRFDVSVPMACYVSVAFTKFVKAISGGENIFVNYHETDSQTAINHVTNFENNIAIIRYQTKYEKYYLQFLEEKDLLVEPLWEFSYQLIMSVKHPLAMEKNIDLSELENYIEITHGYHIIPSLPASKARELVQSDDNRKEIAVYERESQFELLRNIHTTYMWTSPTPDSILNTMPLVQKDCGISDNKYKDVIIYRRGYKLTEQEKLFVQKVKEEIALLQER